MSSEPSPSVVIRYMGNEMTTSPLSEEELQAIQSVKGLVAAYVHPGHSMRDGLPDKVIYVFQPSAPVPRNLISGQLEGRSALYPLVNTDNAQYQKALSQLAAYNFDSAYAYHPASVDVDINTGRDTAHWQSQFDKSTDTLAFVSAEDPYAPKGKPMLLVDTHAGAMIQSIRDVLNSAEQTCSIKDLLDSDLYNRIRLASERNNQRLAASCCKLAQVSPAIVGRDIYSFEDVDPTDQSKALQPEIAIPSHVTKHNSLQRTADGKYISFDRGVARVDQNEPGIVAMRDSYTVASLYNLKHNAQPKRTVIAYGSPQASSAQRDQQEQMLRIHRDINQHVVHNVHWAGKELNKLNPLLYTSVKHTPEQSKHILAHLDNNYEEVRLTVHSSLIPSAL